MTTLLDDCTKRDFIKERCYRLIPSQFPPIHLFEDVADQADFEALFAIQMLTNPRIQDEIGLIKRVPEEDRLYGIPGCGYVMAAFTHINPDGSRFSNGDYGVYYAAHQLSTAIAETVYHKELFLSYTHEPPQELDMRCLIAEFSAQLYDLSNLDKTHHPLYDRQDYHHSQQVGAEVKSLRHDGIYYHSVRSDGYNYALFKPNNILRCQQGAHFSYVWDGKKITLIYEKRSISTSAIKA
jgi:hypothetical protein